MIDAALKIIDRLIQLLQIKAARRNRLFEKLWQPTFEELRDVHSNYISMFESCASALRKISADADDKDTQSTVESVASELQARRLEFEPIRRQLLALISQMDNVGLETTEQEFFEAVLWYFPTGTNRTLPTWASETLALLERYKESVDCDENAARLDRDSLDEVSVYIQNALRHQRVAWDNVCETYSVLQEENARLSPG